MTWLTLSQAADLESVPPNVMRVRLQRRWYRATKGPSGRNGKPQVLVALDSLSEKARTRFVRQHGAPETVSDPIEAPPATGVDLSTLSDGAREEMAARQRAVDAVRAMAAGLVATGLSRTRAEALARAQVAPEHGTTPGTLRRWMRAYRAGGLEALAPRYGLAQRGRSGLDAAVQEQLLAHYLTPQQPNVRTVYRAVAAWCVEHGRAVPSEAVVRRFCRALPPSAQLFHRHGPETWRHLGMPKERRDLNATPVGAWYVGDHRLFDVFVRVQRGGRWRAIRPWVSAWQDIGSRDLVGWLVCEAPNSTTIAQAARMAIRTYGAPGHWYYDNGKDYRSQYLSGRGRRRQAIPIPDACAGILRELGSETHFAQPYTPWAKPIERLFGYLPEWEQTLPGWCGRNNQDKPEKLAAELGAMTTLLTLEEFAARFATWAADYRRREHGELGAAPASRWEGVTRRIPADGALDILLMEEKTVKVYATGIKLYGRYFWADELAAIVGETVTVRIDRTDVGRVLVYRGRRLWCEAGNKPLLTMGATREQLQEAARRKAKARKIVQRFPAIAREALAAGAGLDDALRRAVAEAQQPAPPRAPKPAAPAGPVVRLLTRHDQAAHARAARPRLLAHRLPDPPPDPALPTPDDVDAERAARRWSAARSGILRELAHAREALSEIPVLSERAVANGSPQLVPGLDVRAAEYRAQIARLEARLAAMEAAGEGSEHTIGEAP